VRQVAKVEAWHYHNFVVVGGVAVCSKGGHTKVVLDGLGVVAAVVKCVFGEAVDRSIDNHRKHLRFAEG
jgi:hypothetical protein